MCGIVGYVGTRESVPLLVEGLKKLEYRGYDSAGVAVVWNGRIERVRASGKLRELVKKLEGQPLSGCHGIGHTRWATHGRPSERNAHPIVDARSRVAVIHNGIIENFAVLKEELQADGWSFASETDTEVVANLISAELDRVGDLMLAVTGAVRRLQGHYAFAAVTTVGGDEAIVVARQGPPLCVGIASGEIFLASDPAALVQQTRDVIFLENGDVARLCREGVRIHDAAGHPVTRELKHLAWDAVQVERGGYEHFMRKEIHEQPMAVQATFASRVRLDEARVVLPELDPVEDRLRGISRVQIVACGTSWHAALVGRFLMEAIARVPVDVDYGSEYRYRDPIVGPDVLTLGISQSGETADTLSAMEGARERGALLACICNVDGSQATRISDATLLTHAGPEIGVASTKAFTTQLTALYLLALHLRQLRGGPLDPGYLRALATLPKALAKVLEEEPAVKEIARRYHACRNALFLGRGIDFPIALEGALKLKEISYVHAEGYPAGEMKHGPIALVDPDLLTVALATRGPLFAKMVSNLQEVRARDGRIVVITDQPTPELVDRVDDVIGVPSVGPHLQPIVNVVPLQLFAYHAAVLRGADVDQPRNLAKSVTVE